MGAGAVARRYAQAIFNIATDQNSFVTWLTDLDTVADTFGQAETFLDLQDPKINMGAKLNAVRQTLTGKVQPLALNYACLLVTKGRVNIAGHVRDEFVRLNDLREGVAVANVVTAVAMDQGELDALAKALGQMVHKRITIEATVDPSILGGVIARIGDRLIDASVLSKLRAMRQQLAAR